MFSTLQSASYNPKLDGTGAKLATDEATSDTEGSLFASELEAVESNIENNTEHKSKSVGKYMARLESSFIPNRFEAEAKPEPRMAKLHENGDKEPADSLIGELSLATKSATESKYGHSKLVDGAALPDESTEGEDFYSFVTSSMGMNTHVKSMQRDSTDTSLVDAKEGKPESDELTDGELANVTDERVQPQLILDSVKVSNKDLENAKQMHSLQSKSDDLRVAKETKGLQTNAQLSSTVEAEQTTTLNGVITNLDDAKEHRAIEGVEQNQKGRVAPVSGAIEAEKQLTDEPDALNQKMRKAWGNLADETKQQVSEFDSKNQAAKNVLGNPTDETKKSLSSELVEQTQAAENAYVNEAKEAKRQFTTELSGHNKAKESVTDVSNTHARSDAQQFLNKVMANVSSNAEKSAIAKAVAEQLTQTQSDGKLSVHDALANAADESEIKLGKEASLSFELGHKDVLAKEVVGNAKSMVKETGQVFSIDNVSLNDKGNDAKIAVLEKELNQLSVLEREALRGSLQEKLSQDTLTPAERKVVESVLKALQLSDGKTISLEVKQFVSVKAQEQEAKGSQSKASQNNDAELLNEAPKAELPKAEVAKAEVAKAEVAKAEVAKADTQGFVRGLNENTELADTGIKTSTNSKVTEPVESKLLSKEPAELRQTGVSDTVNSKKIDDKPEVLATANVQLANKSEEAVEHGVDKPESLIEQEQDTLTASQSSNQQQTKMTENAAVLQRIMQTVSQIAQNNSQFDNAVNVQVFQQIEQVQQQQQAVQHLQKVVMDPAMLEAINIARHDAVKELHNRVSMMLNLNNKEAEIRLDPPELGSLQIRIRTDAETAQVNFVVQNQQAKELLEQSLPKLREMLAEQGINLGESSIEHGSSGQSNSDDGSGKGLKARVDSEQIDEGSVENLRTTAKTSSSAIDYYA